MRIFLVRHGQTEGNVDKTLLMSKPDHAIELTDVGKRQAKAAGIWLREHFAWTTVKPMIWTSPYTRARQTAKLIAEPYRPPGGAYRPDGSGSAYTAEIPVREHALLVEQQFGLFDGVPDDKLPLFFPKEHAHYEKHAAFSGRFWARMPLGESQFDVAVRVHQAFGTFQRDAERHGINDIIVVCHGVVIRAFVMMWLHKTPEWFAEEKNPKNGSIRLIDDKTDKGYIFQGRGEYQKA